MLENISTDMGFNLNFSKLHKHLDTGGCLLNSTETNEALVLKNLAIYPQCWPTKHSTDNIRK